MAKEVKKMRGTARIFDDDSMEFRPYEAGKPVQKGVKKARKSSFYSTEGEKDSSYVMHLRVDRNATDPAAELSEDFDKLIKNLGGTAVDFIEGPYWAKMFVLCFYTVWTVMPFKILILTSALASVNPDYYNAARVDGTSKWRIFRKITLPMISPMLFYLVITGFIGAFKAYSDAVALFGTNLNAAEMNTIVGYVYDMLYGDSGGYPSYASAAALILFGIVFTITCINLLISRKQPV